MSKYLVEELKKYYHCQPNGHYQFCNGMSKGQLVFELKRHGAGTSPGAFSDALYGRRPLPFDQLLILMEILGLTASQKEVLCRAWLWDRATPDFSGDTIELQEFRNDMHLVRIQGNPRLVQNRIDAKLGTFLLKFPVDKDDKILLPILRIIPELLLEKAMASLDSDLPEHTHPNLIAIGDQIYEIAAITEDDQLRGLSYIVKGGAYWATDGFRPVIQYLERGLKLWKPIDDLYMTEFLTMLGLAYAYRGEHKKFLSVVERLQERQTTATLNLMTQCHIQSFSGLGYKICGFSGGENLIDSAYQLYAEAVHRGERFPLRQVQLAFCRLYNWQAQGLEAKTVSEVVQEVLQLSRIYGFRRYALKLEQILQPLT